MRMVIFQVLRCANDECRTFQVQQKKKSSKWCCKMCGEKQSLIKVYFESEEASDCRKITQGYNMARGEAQIEHTRVEYLTKVDSIEEKVDSQCSPKKIQNSQHSLQLKNTMASKWDKYLCPDKTGERVELPRQLNDNMKRLEVINGTKDELYTKYGKSTRYFEKFDNDECLSENPSSKKIIKKHQEEKNVEHNLKHELETTVRQPVIKKPKTSENFSLAPKNSSSLISSALHKYKSRIKNKGSI